MVYLTIQMIFFSILLIKQSSLFTNYQNYPVVNADVFGGKTNRGSVQRHVIQ